ncbi:MAG TPA: hypothetical protein VGM68_12480 [Rhizomicrobium sp.]|jgi:hypothetical protein
MPPPTETSTAPRVRCRQIAESDLDRLAAMFMIGFPHHTRDFWDKGLAQVAALPPVEGLAPIGYALEADGTIVGALLTISSRRGDTIISNVSAWYVEPEFRTHSTLLTAMATKHKHVTYLNTSPADHTVKTLAPLGWKPCNFGRSITVPALSLSGGAVSRKIPADLPERKLLEDHRAWGLISLVCKKDGQISPFVFRRRAFTKLHLPIMELMYCRSTADFERCAGALGRHFLLRGALGVLLDGKVSGIVSRYMDGRDPRLYKGPRPPAPNDFAYTEKVFFA